jgi:hypothetical protein
MPLAVLIAATAAVHCAMLVIGRSPALAHVEPSATAVATPGARESTMNWPTAAVYCPAEQAMHAAALEAIEYLPTSQTVQAVAPPQ